MLNRGNPADIRLWCRGRDVHVPTCGSKRGRTSLYDGVIGDDVRYAASLRIAIIVDNSEVTGLSCWHCLSPLECGLHKEFRPPCTELFSWGCRAARPSACDLRADYRSGTLRSQGTVIPPSPRLEGRQLLNSPIPAGPSEITCGLSV